MLIPITYSSHQVREPYVIGITMVLHTVFTMFVDLKLGARLNRDRIGRKDV